MEQVGDYIVRFENEALNFPSLLPDIEKGREMRRTALSRMLDASIQCEGEVRERTLKALYVVNDLYAWRILRRDYGMSPEGTEALIRDMVDAILKHIPFLQMAPVNIVK
jgi:hypothetical protein